MTFNQGARVTRFTLLSCALWVLMPLSAMAQQAYVSAEAAADALHAAVIKGDKSAKQTVLGKDWARFIPTKEIEREDVDAFLAAWDKSHRIIAVTPESAQLEVGEQGWTLPIPIIKSQAGWKFDPRAGADEMRTRRIGRNELATMQAVQAYFDAQKEYASLDRNGDGVLEYAKKLKSSKGKQDGLYWPAGADVAQSPLGPLLADLKPGAAYYGYRYKILDAQGKAAPGGAYSYLIKGRMVSGFALIAWPLRYGDTGVKSFMISHDGQIYEKDLGTKTSNIAGEVTRFDPDSSWSEVQPAALTTAATVSTQP